MSNQNKVVLITGCTRGMGRKLFEYCCQDAKIKVVIGISRPSDKIQKMQSECTRFGNKARVYGVDVTDEVAVQNLANQLKNENLIPDIVVNNAAILGPVKPLWECTPHEFELTQHINVKGVFYLMKFFVPLMLKKPGAVIVNMSSGWGRNVEKNFGVYCTSKWALEGLTMAAAKDAEGHELTIVALAPGIVETDMLAEAKTGQKGVPLDQWIKSFPELLFSINKQHSGQQLSWRE